MKRYNWSPLNNQQLGAYTEYYVKMELTMFGFEVFGTEVDDRGIDFIARHGDDRFLAIQVKSIRPATTYVFAKKKHFKLSPNTYMALGMLKDREAPVLYLIPSTVWEYNPDRESKLFVDRPNYDEPEWGINVSQRNMEELNEYKFEKTLEGIIG
jgi:hypothetical protein